MKINLIKSSIFNCILILGMMLFLSTVALAANDSANADTEIGIAYRGHVQNQGNMPRPEGSMVAGPDALGTRGLSLRVEGFWLDLTGDLPEGAKLVYQVHVENRGWMSPVSDGNFAGTSGESLRVESIRISLENLPGYDVYYRGHVQNVGDIPQVDGKWGWVKNGADLGTTGSSLRLEELQVKIVKQPEVIYDKAGTFGPKTGMEVIDNDVTINKDGVVLQNLHIKGNLTIAEAVGEGDVTLNNITVDGETYVRGGGKNSIHINGGDYNKITVMQTSSGQVRIVATNAEGLEVVVSEDAKGEDIILEGTFESVTIDAPEVKISTQGDTTIKEMLVAKNATDSQITLDKSTTIEKLSLNAGVDMKGEGAVKEANVNSDNVTFEKAPDKANVAPEVSKPPVVTPPAVTPPVVPPAPDSGGGGGGVSSEDLLVAEYTNATTIQVFVTLLDKNALGLDLTSYASLDTIGKELVGSLLLKQDNFASKAVVQATAKTAIASAVADMQTRAITVAKEAYQPCVVSERHQFTITNPSVYSAEQKKLLADLYSDYSFEIDRPLNEGESFKLTFGSKTVTIDSQMITDNSFKLSKILGKTLASGDLLINQKNPTVIIVNDKSLKLPIGITAHPCITRDQTNYTIIPDRYSSLNVFPASMDVYMDALQIKFDGSKFTVAYAGIGNLYKPGLAGYYSDALLNLGSPLEDGESITIEAFGATIPITNALVDGTSIRLSELLNLTFTDANLAANQKGSFDINITSKQLNHPNSLSIYAILVKDEAMVELNNYFGTNLFSSGIDAFTKSISIEDSSSEIKVNYAGLNDDQKSGLDGYYSDLLISIYRPLKSGESLTLKAFNKEVTITEATGVVSQIRLSTLMGTTLDSSQLAVNKSGCDSILLENVMINDLLQVNIQPVLAKTDGPLLYVDPCNVSVLYPSDFSQFKQSIEFATNGSTITATYSGVPDQAAAALEGYYSDITLHQQRPLEADESYTVTAFGKTATVTSDRIPEAYGNYMIRLSELLELTPSEIPLAATQKGTVDITFNGSGLAGILPLSTFATVVKAGGEPITLDRKSHLELYPPFVQNYQDSLTQRVSSSVAGSNSFEFIYDENITEANKALLSNYYADTQINFSRTLYSGEEVLLAAYGQEVTVNSDSLTDNGGTCARLSDILLLSLGEDNLASAQTGRFEIVITDKSLREPVTITTCPMLVSTTSLTNPTSVQYLNQVSESILSPWKTAADLGVEYRGFVDAWDSDWTRDGQALGIPDSNPGYDAVQLQLTGTIPEGGKITYRTFSRCQPPENYKWNDFVSNGATAGDDTLTDSIIAPIEGIEIKLENMPDYTVMYQVYVQGRGWQQWMSNGELAGTTGLAQTIKALRVRIVKN